jgi:methionyl-tRNA synthetase
MIDTQITGIAAFLTIFLIALIVAWEAVWKGIGLWKAGRSNQPVWFIAIFILNTAGLLPIIYLAFFQKKFRKKHG